jgi:hypothetical protein
VSLSFLIAFFVSVTFSLLLIVFLFLLLGRLCLLFALFYQALSVSTGIFL